ncbi:MAG: hypothetical protein ACOYUZ_04245 [Patescibacteria group bacterium]
MSQEKLILPAEKRFDIAPALEDGRAVFMSARLRKSAEAKGLSDLLISKDGVSEYVGAEDVADGMVEIDNSNQEAADAYLTIVSLRRELRLRLEAMDKAREIESETGLQGLAGLFADQVKSHDTEYHKIQTDYQEIDNLLKEIRSQTMQVRHLSKGVKSINAANDKQKLQERNQILERAWNALMEIYARRSLRMPDAIPHDASTIKKQAKVMLYGLARQGDAKRKYAVYAKDQQHIGEQEQKLEIFSKILRLRQVLENKLQAGGYKQNSKRIIDEELAGELDQVVEELAQSGLIAKPGNMPDDVYRANLKSYILSQLEMPAEVMRVELAEKQKQLAERRQCWQDVLTDARHADLAEYARDKEVEELLRLYHISGKRFIPVGNIKRELSELDQIITGPNGPILRAFLYGPPGTGKTESLREIGNLHEQRVRVISLHETSTFETLVGMHQIPLPKAETVADAERFWLSIKNLNPIDVAKEVPTEVLTAFAGKDLTEKAADFKRWFEIKLKSARAVAALGAVSPDDPRVRKASQAALAAWLDQPLAEGLINGDLIILDEADRAGNALEGLQDLLTRRPGDEYQPPGRPGSFKIHPDARVVMTANWGDAQTEFSGGSGRLSAPIASRVVEKRSIGYLDPDTEMQLFEIMTSNPDGRSMLTASEYRMAECLIKNIFPRLRDFYLHPGELQFLTPMSVRTLENIKRRLIDETTRTRTRDSRGDLIMLVEAAWQEVSAGPFRDDQRERIINELAKIFSDSGIFNHLPAGTGASKSQIAAQVMSLDAAKTAGFMGEAVAFKGDGQPVTAEVLLGQYLAKEERAQNKALKKQLRFLSPGKAKILEQEQMRREIEDMGGTPEIQAEFDRMRRMLADMVSNLTPAEVSNPERLLKAGVELIENELRGKKLSIPMRDIELLCQRLVAEQSQQAVKDGLLLQMIINKTLSEMPQEDAKKAVFRLDLTASGNNGAGLPLDHLGHAMPAGTLIIKGIAGEFTARELCGGTVLLEEAGDKLAYGMKSGTVKANKVGRRACRRMRGGIVEIKIAGDRLCQEMTGGTVSADTAGNFAGQGMSGFLKIGRAGDRLGEDMATQGTINVTSHQGLGRNIKGTIVCSQKTIVDKGEKKVA